MRRAPSVLAGLALIGCSVIGPSTVAQAAPIGASLRCGDVLTTSTTLQHDLVDCPSNGLVIGADGITLNLNGHVVAGDGASSPQCLERTCDVGIDNTGGYDGLTIERGSITGFDFGVSADQARHLSLTRLQVTRNRLSGAILSNVEKGRVERTTITRNGLTTDFAGLSVFGSTGLTIERNEISDSGDVGLFIMDGSSRNVIRNNRIDRNPEDGILLNGDDNLVTGNVLSKDGGGVALGGNRNRVTRNKVLDVLPCAEGCRALGVEEGSANVLSRNVVRRSPTGISVEAYGPLTARTVVEGNLVEDSVRDGISVDVAQPGGTVSGTSVKGNKVRRSGDDGIDVGRAPAATLTRNRSSDNRDLGIEAAAGVGDGGGNRASGNGNSLQCTNVRCRTTER